MAIESPVLNEREGHAEADQAALLPPEREEPAQGRPEGQIGRVDVVHRGRRFSCAHRREVGLGGRSGRLRVGD